MRTVVGALALVSALVLTLTGALAGPAAASTLAAELGSVGVALLAGALWRWPGLLPPALVLVAVPWGLALTERARPFESVAVGVGLLVTGELAGWTQDLSTVVPPSGRDSVRIAVRTALLALGCATVSTLLLVVSALPAPASLLRLLVGLGAALAVVALLTLRRWDPA
jgi:hypothetical protein